MKKMITIREPKSIISEAYRNLRTNIEFSNLDSQLKVISATSSMQGEGKTTVISNLAVTFANLEKKVLIIDGDLRNPTVHRIFEKSNIHGLTDILIRNKNLMECVHPTENENLQILTCGQIPPNPSEILSSKKMKAFVESLRKHYDYIFIDAPAIGIVTDAGIISTYSDGIVFVVGSNEVDIEYAQISKDRLDKVGANIIGAILNKYEASSDQYYNYYYRET